MARRERTRIAYDIDFDIQIVTALDMADNMYTLNLSQLKEQLTSSDTKLDAHLEKMRKWGIIYDEKPRKNGKPRKISLAKNHVEAIDFLLKLKESIDYVNDYL